MADKKEIQFDAKNEQIVIGLMLVDSTIRDNLVRTLRSTDFIGERHQHIFSGLNAIVSQGLSYTEPTLIQVAPGDIGNIVYLNKLRALVVDRVTPLRNNLETHIRILHFERVKHQLLVTDIPALHEMVEDEECNQEKLKRELRRLGGIAESIVGQSYVERDKSIIDAYTSDQKAVVGTRTTGYRILDYGVKPGDTARLTMGTAPGGVGILAARPSTGKSMLSTQIARRVSAQDIGVNICAFEMNKIPTTHLLIPQWITDANKKGARYPDVTLSDLVSRRYKDSSLIKEALDGLFSNGKLGIMRNPVYFVHDVKNNFGRRIHPSEMNERNLDLLESQVANDKADVWIFDLWERLMRSKDQADIAAGLERMQAMAHYYQKFFLIVQQIGREYTKSTGRVRDSSNIVRPPRMEDIKNSGAYEEVADWILILYRPSLYRNVPDDLLEVYCAKQRLGAWPWGVAFNFDGARAKIDGGHRISVNQYEEDKVAADGGAVY